MKNYFVPNTNFFNYVKNNLSADPRQLLLRDSGRETDFPIPFAVTQIECRRKTAAKLSSFIAHEQFLFPSLLAAEQSTHQSVAIYHTTLIAGSHRVLDMTAGLGIDAFSFSKAGNEVTAVEMDGQRADILRHNAVTLGLENFHVVCADSLAWLADARQRGETFDLVFIDPARRDRDNKRTYFLADCVPDVTANFNLIASAAPAVLIKGSPILDITRTIEQLPAVSELHVVCVKGECKEVLIVCDTSAVASQSAVSDPIVRVVDLDDDFNPVTGKGLRSMWHMDFSEWGNNAPVVGPAEIEPDGYIYDPNAGIHKLVCAERLCRDFDGLKRLSPNTDLYYSKTLFENFPGRRFKVISLPDRQATAAMKGAEAEVIARNYPLRADELRKKLKLRSGGSRFVIGCRVGNAEKPLLLECVRTE